MLKPINKKCIDCGNDFVTKNRTRKYCNECWKIHRKKGDFFAFRREVILPNGEVVFLTVKEQKAAEYLVLYDSNEVAKMLKWKPERVEKLATGKNPRLPNFPEVIRMYAEKIVPQIEPMLLKGFMDELKKKVKEDSEKDKFYWIKAGLEHFRQLPQGLPEKVVKKLSEEEKEKYLNKAKEERTGMDKPVDME